MRCLLALLVVCLVLGCAGDLALAAAPVITNVNIDRIVRSNAPGSVVYDETIVVTVSDSDYTTDIASVTIADSASPPEVMTFTGSQGQAITNTAASFTWTRTDLLNPPPAAPYSFQAQDYEGNTDAFTSGTPPALAPLHLSVVAPAMDSVISSVQPTLQWQNPYASTEKTTRLTVYEEGQQSSVWYRDISDGSVSAVYGINGTTYIGRTRLLANHSYVWSVHSGTGAAVYSMPGTSTGAHRLTMRDWQEVHGRFTEFGPWSISPPTLPGKLAYGVESVATLAAGNWGVTGILEYGTDPNVRTWVGPEYGNDPDWSPDGERLLYASPSGLQVHDFGSGTTSWIPGTSGTDAKCRWTPDGSGIIFGRAESDTSYGVARTYSLWQMQADGSGAHVIGNISGWELTPSPSPDGAWIAYDSTDGYSPSTLHVVAYDGSNDHVITAAEVVGQDPGYTVTSLLQPAWSPDGTKLAVVFQADGTGLPTLVGIGTLPAAGGPLTPLFISPYAACCAKPQAPAWSPDGSQVVFTSGHQRPDLWGYDTIWASELWLVPADGSLAPPVQLTNDSSLDRNVSWWRANTPAGTNVVFSRGSVTLTFASVSADGMSQILVLDQPPGPAPAGFVLLPTSYQTFTTAQYSGNITVAISYQDSDVPVGASENGLVLLEWENGQWVPLASSVDTTNNVVTGTTTSLGIFALAVTLPPTADFLADPTTGVAPLTVQFTDTSSHTPTAWSWDFGDGSTSQLENPAHTYASVGYYTVSLTATNAGGSSVATVAGCVAVYQFTGPLAPIKADGSSVFGNRPSVPVDFQLTDASGASVATAEARLFVAPVTDGVAGAYLPATSSSYAGNAFTYDAKKGIYDFPLSTRSLSAGVWSLQITVNGSFASEFTITLDTRKR